MWIAQVGRMYWQPQGVRVQDMPKNDADSFMHPFYDGAWELCRRGALRPGHVVPLDRVAAEHLSRDGYAITSWGRQWLRNAVAERATMPSDSSRLAEVLLGFQETLLHERAADAVHRAWHRQNAEVFEYLGGGLLPVVFPEFSPELEGRLKEVLAIESAGAARFVADVLAGYRGLAATHELYKLIVDAVPDDDLVPGSVEGALISTGVVHGEFGMVEAYRQKKAEFQAWLLDLRPSVKAFAETHDRMLDRMIAAEQRRSEEDIEARKRQYGDGTGQAGGSTAR